MQPTIGSSDNRASTPNTRKHAYQKKVIKLTCQNTQLRQLMVSIPSRKFRINVLKVRRFLSAYTIVLLQIHLSKIK